MIVVVKFKLEGEHRIFVPDELSEHTAKEVAEDWVMAAHMLEFDRQWIDPKEMEDTCKRLGVPEFTYQSIKHDDLVEESFEVTSKEIAE